ncbi:MAG: FliO/MopB family protein [Clostridiales bacterium]|nr:FliO/MopB family protein [Clostridiales bacterium]
MNGFYETSGFMNVLKVIYIIIVFAIVLGISYYFSKFIGKRMTKQNKHMRIIETLTLGNDRHLHIVSIYSQFYLISSSQKGICLIDKITDNNLIEQLTYEIDGLSSLDSYLNNVDDDLESYHYNNSFKNNIKKLKNLIKGNRKNV